MSRSDYKKLREGYSDNTKSNLIRRENYDDGYSKSLDTHANCCVLGEPVANSAISTIRYYNNPTQKTSASCANHICPDPITTEIVDSDCCDNGTFSPEQYYNSNGGEFVSVAIHKDGAPSYCNSYMCKTRQTRAFNEKDCCIPSDDGKYDTTSKQMKFNTKFRFEPSSQLPALCKENGNKFNKAKGCLPRYRDVVDSECCALGNEFYENGKMVKKNTLIPENLQKCKGYTCDIKKNVSRNVDDSECCALGNEFYENGKMVKKNTLIPNLQKCIGYTCDARQNVSRDLNPTDCNYQNSSVRTISCINTADANKKGGNYVRSIVKTETIKRPTNSLYTVCKEQKIVTDVNSQSICPK